MTNKIYLSVNRLYSLKDGDYHGATLSFKIKHGDKVVAEGERVGKSLSQFISPIPIEEMKITEPLTIEYVCTGNVEDVSVSPVNPALGDKLLYLDGKVFIRDAFVQDAIITNAVANNIDALQDCKKRFDLEDDALPFGGFPGVKMGKINLPEFPDIIETNPELWCVSISWGKATNLADDAVIQVQYISKDGSQITTAQAVDASSKKFVIGGLKVGEEIECRLRVISGSGKKSEWSSFVKVASISDASFYLSEMDVMVCGIPAGGIGGMQLGVDNSEEEKHDDLPEKLSSAISEQVRSSIKQELQAGGLIWRAMTREGITARIQ